MTRAHAMLLAALGLYGLPSLALAQQPAMPGMAMTAPAASATAATKAFKAADDKMMKNMDGRMTGDPDRDFVTGMLPHHAGAIDMALVELRYGKDPALRRLAREIIAAQDKEIRQMQTWKNTHPARP